MDKKTILFGVVGLLVLIWIVKRMQPGETQVVSQLVPVGSVPNNSNVEVRAIYDANKTQAFLGVLELGKSQVAARIQELNIESQLPLENVRADVARSSFARDIDISKAQFARDIELGGLSSKTAIQLAQLQTDSELAQTMAGVRAAEQQLEYQQQNLIAGTNAINYASNAFRKQSLERQGTILNALTTLYTGQAPYNYQSAMGGQRPPTFMQQLFPGGVGGVVKSILGLF